VCVFTCMCVCVHEQVQAWMFRCVCGCAVLDKACLCAVSVLHAQFVCEELFVCLV